MKLIEIKFRNINSLKGEHVISFVKEPLATAGIFAITGANGSGKSTILDVITLALFNKIPRFSSAISKKDILEFGSVITHHSKEAYASVTYESKGIQYTSTWSIRTNRNGNLDEYDMSLYDEAGTPFDLRKSEIAKKNEELIGLNYEQFIKSIILSQGQFAKFIKAEKHERGELLENITGTHIYRALGIKAYEKYRDSRNLYDEKNREIGGVQVLSKVEKEEIQEEIKSNIEIRQEFNDQLIQLNQIISIKKDYSKTLEDLQKILIEKTTIEQAITDFKPLLAKLKLFDAVAPFNDQLVQYQQGTVTLQNLKPIIAGKEEELRQQKTQLNDLLKQLEKYIDGEVTEVKFLDLLRAFERSITTLDQEITNYQTEINRLQQSIQNTLPLQSVPNLAVDPIEACILRLNEHTNQLNMLLDEANIARTDDRGFLSTSLHLKRHEIDILKTIKHGNDAINVALTQKKNQEETLLKHQKERKNLVPILEEKGKLVQALKSNWDLLIEQQQNSRLIARYEEQRHSLKDGEACPLCGAAEHPYTAGLLPIINDLDEPILKAGKDYNNENNALTSINKQLIELNTNIIHVQKILEDLNNEINDLQRNNDNVTSTYTGAHQDFSSEYLSKTIEALIKEVGIQEKGISALTELTHVHTLLIDYTALLEKQLLFTEKTNERNERFPEANIHGYATNLSNTFNHVTNAITGLTIEIQGLINQQEAAHLLVANISQELQPHIQQLGFDNFEALKVALPSSTEIPYLRSELNKLESRKVANQTEITRLEELKQRLIEQDTQSESLLDDLELQQAAITENITQIEQKQGQFRERLERDLEQQKRIKGLITELNVLKKNYTKWELLKGMIGDASGNTFSNFAQGLTLQNLLVHANTRLQLLSDRYLLDKPTKEGPLNVIDLYQGNIKRAVTTLCGGETFLISLALALSLSDMASRNVALDSLFIDEGFGNLDPESLDLAMNTLNRLQQEGGKTIGVISHVEPLKDSISVQIKLHKNAQGYSSIEIDG